MLNKIAPYDNKFYEYNGYVFYENSNFRKSHDGTYFPVWNTMACYNDEKNVMCFIGFNIHGTTDEKYIDDIENNWGDFLKQYFGVCHDFDE